MDKESRRFWLVSAALAVSGLLVFRQAYQTFIAPHYPASFDQLAQLENLYAIYYGILGDSTRSFGGKLWATAGQLMNMKGWVFPTVATVLGQLFGPHRGVFIITNYLFLVLAGMILLRVLRRRFGTSFALAGLGLVLLSDSLYLPAGGLADLRWDIAGLASFGIFFMAFWLNMVDPGRGRLTMTILGYAFTVFTRSTSGVLGLASVGVFGIVCVAAYGLSRRDAWRRRCLATLGIGVSMSAVFAVFLAIHYREFRDYYVQLLLTPEDAIRLREFGVASRVALFAYYGNSFAGHFTTMLAVGGVLLVAHLAVRTVGAWLGRAGIVREPPPPTAGEIGLTVAIALSFIAGTVLTLSLYSPSPIVIGILTMPLAVTLIAIAAAIAPAIRGLATTRGGWLANCAVLVAGCGMFLVENMSHRVWPEMLLAWARDRDRMFEQLSRDYADAGATLSLLALNDGTAATSLSVYLYETQRFDAVRRFDANAVHIFAVEARDVVQRIAAADAVIAHRDFPAVGYLYPSLESLRDTQNEWQGILDRQFVLRTVARLPWMTLGYYTRPAMVRAMTGPFGVEYDSPRNRMRDAWAWIDSHAAEVVLRNFRDTESPFELELDVVPGPGVDGGAGLMIAYAGAVGAAQLPVAGAPPWHMRLPLRLPPGESTVRFTASVQRAVAAVQGGVQPLARIGHLRFAWNDR